MNRSSFFIAEKALFGSYPSKESFEELKKNNIKYFIDLTCKKEKGIIPYFNRKNNFKYLDLIEIDKKENIFYMNYPIKDYRVPLSWSRFSLFIIKISKIIYNLNNLDKIYIHCKGGHGRAGIVVSCLLCYMYSLLPSEALSKTNYYHSLRKEMREKWRRIGSPQTRAQKHFVSKFFEPLYIYNNNLSSYFSNKFHNDINISIRLGNYIFKNVTDAYYFFKKHYINLYEKSEWDKIHIPIMIFILKTKFLQNPEIFNNLLNTGLRPIFVISKNKYWGYQNYLKIGKNINGKLLFLLREYFYLSNSNY